MLLVGFSTALGGCGADLQGSPTPGEPQSVFSIWSPPSPAEAAAWAADPYDADKRQRGLLLLANAPFGGEPVYVRVYQARLADEDANVRAAAARALALHGEPEDVEQLARLLTEDENSSVRRAAARALQRLHSPVAIGSLVEASDDRFESDAQVRAFAATALGQYTDPQVVNGLVAALRDRRLTVNHAALGSLRVLTGQDFGYDVREWLEWVNETDDLFAGGGTYVYPVFRRDPTIWELFLPWDSPPNEVAAKPAGMP